VRRIYLFFIFSILFNAIYAQTDSAYIYAYGGTNDDYSHQIISTIDSGFIIVGTTSSFGLGNSDVYILKIDSNCNRQWSRVYGTPSVDWGYSIRQTYDGGYIVVGFTNAQTANGYDIYLLKIDSYGNHLWTKMIGGTDWDFGYALELTADSGYIITGKSYSFTNGGSDLYLVKTDSMGNTIWQKNYGGINEESGNAIIHDRDYNFLIIGETKSYGAGDKDYYVLKVNGNGDTIWTKTFGSIYSDAGLGLDTSLDGNYLIIGTLGSDTTSQAMFMKLDTTGSTIWTQIAGGSNNEEGRIIKQLPNGQIFTGGMTQSFGAEGKNFLVYRDDSDGNYIAGAGFGGDEDDEGFSIAVGKDIRMVGTGITKSYGCGFNDIYLVRFPNYMIENEYYLSIHEICDAPIGINDIEKTNADIDIYPNPATDFFKVSYSKSIKNQLYNLDIFDISGRKIENYPNIYLPLDIDVNLNSGTYILKLYEEDNTCAIGKLIVY
jgi:hypothetical protein